MQVSNSLVIGSNNVVEHHPRTGEFWEEENVAQVKYILVQ